MASVLGADGEHGDVAAKRGCGMRSVHLELAYYYAYKRGIDGIKCLEGEAG